MGWVRKIIIHGRLGFLWANLLAHGLIQQVAKTCQDFWNAIDKR
jgi:hypothetical protein